MGTVEANAGLRQASRSAPILIPPFAHAQPRIKTTLVAAMHLGFDEPSRDYYAARGRNKRVKKLILICLALNLLGVADVGAQAITQGGLSGTLVSAAAPDAS